MKRLKTALPALVLLPVLIAAGPAAAHELHGAVGRGEATVVTFTYADGTAFSHESFEIYRPGSKTPFQIGRTDVLGRVFLVTEEEGDWRVRVFSEDGHGADISIPASAAGSPAASAPPAAGRSSRVVLGLGIILGLFGALSLLRRNRKK